MEGQTTVDAAADAPVVIPVTPSASEQETAQLSVTAADETNSVSTTTATTTTSSSASAERGGVCPVKEQYRRQGPTRVTLQSDGRTRGMNKGSDRLQSERVAGTERPTFEGERNFFTQEVIQRVKNVLKTQKRPRNNEKPRNAAAAATAASADPSSISAGASETTTVADRPSEATPQPEENVAANAQRAENRLAAASETEIYITPPDVLRENAAKRDLLFRNKTYLAPLTTVGNLPFRRIVKEYGADVTVSEMATVYNLNHMQKGEWSLLRRHESEKVFGIQLAVSRPDDAAAFAKALHVSGFDYDYIDINCGCPVDKIVQFGCGCGLWEKKSRMRDVVKNLVKFQPKPVTIKCRIGPDESDPQLHKQIGEYESWGASAVTIHGRSRKQRYTKLANWSYINECAQLTNLPVIGNGDIMSWEDLQQHRLEQPTVSSVMLGRGALIKPWVFQEMATGQTMDLSSSERFDMLRRFTNYSLAHYGADEKGILTTRRFLCEALSFFCRYVPVGLLERLPQRINERPPPYEGRDEMETLMASDSVMDWISISEMLLGPAGDKFQFTPKHKSNSYASAVGSAGGAAASGGAEDEG